MSARIWFALDRQQKRNTDVLFIVRADEAPEAMNAAESLLSIIPENAEKPELCLWEGDTAKRAAALKKLCGGPKGAKRFHILSEETLYGTFPDAAAYKKRTVCLKRGHDYPRHKITAVLIENGYERVPFVEERGEYAARGSVLDIFPLDAEKPCRLFFDDDRLSSIRWFEIDTQHTSGFLEKFEVPPRTFGEIRKPFLSFFDGKCFAVAENDISLESWPDCPQDSADAAADLPELYITGMLDSMAAGGSSEENILPENFGALRNINFALSPEILSSEIKRLHKSGCKVYFFCINKGEAERMAEIMQGRNLAGTVIPCTGYIYEGFVCPAGKIAVITASEYLKRRYSFSRTAQQIQKKFFKWGDLKVGDYVVHEDYGIALYRGLKKVYYRTADGTKAEDSDCLFLEYARGDTMFVPLDDFTKVQKFVSSEGKRPHLSHMDTKTWKEVKHRVTEEVREMAGNILRMEAERAICRTVSFERCADIEDAFEEAFPYEETPGQKNAINDVLRDMEAEVPMNRLVAGDVGFGKTEVAMRAAMRAVANGRQVAVIAPTTILADQHYHSFLERFAGFPVKIKMLSRFVPKKEQNQTLKEMAAGKVDITVGTHRLFQKDVKFARLGLMVVDEEHRFGVKAKDRIKETAKGVHCLLMSATPIPRTLYQSLSALKSMSVIESPPVGRQAVATFVRPFSEKDAASAVAYELARGGQVYYVHNRVKTIESRCAYLKKIMPELRIAVIHGQLDSDSVAGTMKKFLNREYDVLMATTIIESGIDIPNINTLIVENAHELGLAQLYQLRGRIGRGSRKAFCYLYYPGWIRQKNDGRILTDSGEGDGKYGTKEKEMYRNEQGKGKKIMSEDAARRLNALEEFTALGSGLRLAMRDLEIRGAGDLLGIKQHGFINTVGLEMYIQLLNGEINRLKGKAPKDEPPDPELDIIISAFIPESYIDDEMERLNCYKKILKAPLKQLPQILKDMEDIAGPAPEPVKNLFRAVSVKKRLGRIGVRSAGQIKNNLELYFRRSMPVPAELPAAWSRAFGSRLSFIPSPEGDGLRFSDISSPMELLEKFLEVSEGRM